jgi:hypothetical protein
VKGQGGSIEAEGPVIADGQLFVTSGYDKWAEMPGNMLLVFSFPNQTLTVLETLMNLVNRSALLIAALGIGLYLALQPTSPIDVNKKATVADARTSVIGLNHIGLSVRDLDAALAFYKGAT